MKEANLFENIIQNIPHYIFWKDRESRFLGCNENFAKAAGLKNRADIIGKTDYDLPWKKSQSDAYRKDDEEVIDGEWPSEDGNIPFEKTGHRRDHGHPSPDHLYQVIKD